MYLVPHVITQIFVLGKEIGNKDYIRRVNKQRPLERNIKKIT